MEQKNRIPALIIGSGAAGGVIARELGRAKIKTVVLEQGPFHKPGQVSRDPIVAKYQNPLFADPQKHKLFFQSKAEEKPVSQNPPWGACVGGSTVHFSGNAMRFHPEDFRQKSVSGSVAGADLVDWPISYDQLKPYYDRVEKEVGISGLLGSNPFAPQQDQPYPMPPYHRTSAGAIFEHAAVKAGLHPFPTPKFINTIPYNGRGACAYQGLCGGYMCPTHAKGSMLVTMIPEALETGFVQIKPHCKVMQVLLDGQGRADGVVYFNASGKEERIFAEKIFLCANAIESTRLLLLSQSGQYPRGLLNNHDLVGRYFMIPIGVSVSSLHPYGLGYYGNISTRRVEDFYNQRTEFDFPGGFVLEEIQNPLPVDSQMSGLSLFGEAVWGEKKIKALHDYPNNVVTWIAAGSCLPQRENRITLHPEEKDVWGLPVPLVQFNYHESDAKLMKYAQNTLSNLVSLTDVIKSWSVFSPLAQGIGPLFIGGIRMGKIPEDSIVNSFGQSHEIPNLYIMGTGIFSTSGRTAPTQTIMALAMRAAAMVARGGGLQMGSL